MDPFVRAKDPNCNGSAVVLNQSTTSVMIGVCNSNSFGINPPTHHDLVSVNSAELNAGASLSDDSGVPLTTNSSISSGDSFRLGMCKLEIEMVESDGEVSQFDSLDNCSEGGMSTENFNTLKKGPLAPIDPPPEFQDSPQTTLVRSVPNNIVNTIRRWSLSQSSFDHIKDTNEATIQEKGIENNSLNVSDTIRYANRSLKDTYSLNKHLYSSDSILNTYTDNIYDEPNNIISTSLGTSIDINDSDSSSPIPLPSCHSNTKQSICPFYQDHTRYFKAIPSEQDNLPIGTQRCGLLEMHDNSFYSGSKRSTYHYDINVQRKLIHSPLNHSYHYHGHHYHTGIGSCGNRPNSRNSLNSRLSSSHNSLGVSNANKADDSIFITQAMSHDALLTREISDFYNVPIDSDIYAFPIDMIRTEKEADIDVAGFANGTKEIKKMVQSSEVLVDQDYKCHNQKSIHKNNKSKRRKRVHNHFTSVDEKLRQSQLPAKTINTMQINTSNCEKTTNEPLHMSLEEVKQFYHTLYSDTDETFNDPPVNVKSLGLISSNETIFSFSSTRSKTTTCKANRRKDNTIKNALAAKTNVANTKKDKLCLDNDNINNNNNIAITNHNNHQQISKVSNSSLTDNEFKHPQTVQGQQLQQTANNKISLQTEKKSQFTLNLKQKFCSIFRFRKSHNRCRGNTDSDEYISNSVRTSNPSQLSEDKKIKFQSRALPPLPNKENNFQVCCEQRDKKPEYQSFHFTSSIEKVKDYGWYWGPLSSEAAEKVLSNEPDGSFIVRDSSDDHYIFSLSFKLNSCVRHVRIEQDQGTFSFGSYAKFKSQTITEFIEKAVEHSRSGRYLFFLHRRPEHGPMRVQLTNPVSRFKHVQSLQHMCRFVILKAVIRKDLIQSLPLPRRLLDYLNYKHYFSEQIESDSSQSQISEE